MRWRPLQWLVASLVPVGLVVLAGFYLARMHEGHLRVGRSELVGAMKVWDAAGRPEGAALTEFLKKTSTQDPRGYFETNLVLTVETKQMQTIFATTRIGRSGVLVVTTNREFILLQPDRAPRLLTW